MIRPFAYVRPESVGQAVDALAQDEARLLAGGMTLLPAMKHALSAPAALVDLGGIDALKAIAAEKDFVRIGAMSTHAEVAASKAVRECLPAVAGLAAGIGDVQVRHRGTIGGSVANNDPAADYPAACLALGATIETDQRRIGADAFFTGFFSTALQRAEVITGIGFPVPQQAAYMKFANPASRYAMVGVFVARMADGVRVAVTGAGRGGVFRVPAYERALQARFAPESLAPGAIAEQDLIADLHASAAYRAHLVLVMARRAVAACNGVNVSVPMRHGGGHVHAAA